MNFAELFHALRRMREDDPTLDELPVMSNHPGSGFPWGEVESVKAVRGEDERYHYGLRKGFGDIVFLKMEWKS